MKAVRAPARGFSVVELMVALLLGFVVVWGVFVTYSGTVLGSQQQRAFSAMAEGAQMGFSLLRRDILAAGYVHPDVVSGSRFEPVNANVTARPIFGCNRLFTDPSADVGLGTCSTAGSLSDAIEISFEASRDSALLTAGEELADCLGAALMAQGQTPQSGKSTAQTRIAVSHRYFVDLKSGTKTPYLYCASSRSAQDGMVPYVEQLTIRYGLSSGWVAGDPATRRPVRYVDASAIAGPQWADVVTVRVCLLMRSASEVLSSDETETLKYRDCVGDEKSSSDRFMRRAFVTTIGLRNRGPM